MLKSVLRAAALLALAFVPLAAAAADDDVRSSRAFRRKLPTSSLVDLGRPGSKGAFTGPS
jgi:hypothetical protein